MRFGVIKLGVKPLDSGGGCIRVISASSLDSLETNKSCVYNDAAEGAQQINMPPLAPMLRGHTCLRTFSCSRSSLPAMNLSS